MENCLSNARLLSKALEASGWYVCISDIHRQKGEHKFKGTKATVFGKDDETSADYNAGLPVVAFRLSDDFKKDYPHVKQESVSTLLRVRQYIIPSKSFPPRNLYTLYSNSIFFTPKTIPSPRPRRKLRFSASSFAKACPWTYSTGSSPTSSLLRSGSWKRMRSTWRRSSRAEQ